MSPTAIATRVYYKPPIEPCDLTAAPGQMYPTFEQMMYIAALQNAKDYDKWHVEVTYYNEGFPCTAVLAQTFDSEEEAKGFMAGWNAHRSAVSEKLFTSRVARKKK